VEGPVDFSGPFAPIASAVDGMDNDQSDSNRSCSSTLLSSSEQNSRRQKLQSSDIAPKQSHFSDSLNTRIP
jgi:hypothetical protein